MELKEFIEEYNIKPLVPFEMWYLWDTMYCEEDWDTPKYGDTYIYIPEKGIRYYDTSKSIYGEEDDFFLKRLDCCSYFQVCEVER